MSLYPDLAECGIAFMHFSMHVPGGWKYVDDFWASHGYEEGEERLLFSSYTRNGTTHTIWLRWDRSHKECCDVWIGLESERPGTILPNRQGSTFRLREKDFKEFLRLLSVKAETPLRVRVRYGFPWDKRLEDLLRLPPRARPTSVSFEVLDEREKPVMLVTYERHADASLAIVAPKGRFTIDKSPVTNDFFKAPYETACLLAKSLGQGQLQTP